MSHPRFRDMPSAVAMYLAGQCRRWAIVDGWLVDLHREAYPVEVMRRVEPPAPTWTSSRVSDEDVEARVRAWLRGEFERAKAATKSGDT